MAGEINDSNRSSSLSADLDTTNHNPMAHDSAFAGSPGSSRSSFLATPFKSELDSSATDNDDDEFILELTRQMQDYMLQDDDDDNDNKTPVECFVSQNSITKNQNQNQHRVVVNSKRGRRWKTTESTQRMKYPRPRGRARPVGYGQVTSSGSGMRAVFLDRPGSKTGYNGTGVFLPPSANCPTAQSRKIPGCSAALVPTRVLEALEQHFNNLLEIQPTKKGQRSGMQQNPRWRSTSINHVEKKLPREWTY